MSPNPEDFIAHLQSAGYHPRSDKHSNALAEAMVKDFITHCAVIERKAAVGALVYDLNFMILAGTSEWRVDLAMGAPDFGAPPPAAGTLINRRRPSTVEIAIEIKSVMTEHRKAIKNRKRDFEAHHEHVHHYNALSIAGAVLVVNAAGRFRSPLRQGVTKHPVPHTLVQHCLDQLRAVAVRGGTTGYGLEARCAVVVSHDNIDSSLTDYFTLPPAPSVGDPLHYDAFIQTVCRHYSDRFGHELPRRRPRSSSRLGS